MKLDRKELAEKLNITLNNLKQLERRGNLGRRLEDKGYKLIKKITTDKTYFFIKDIKEDQESMQMYRNLCKYAYNTNKPQQFGLFFRIRTLENNKPITNREISEIAEIGINTVTKWNNSLLDKGIILKDGFFYFYIDNFDKKIKTCSKEEYKNFWRNIQSSRKREKLQDDFLNEKITLEELMRKSEENGATRFYTEGKYYYRIHKYKTNEDNKLYIDTKELIEVLSI